MQIDNLEYLVSVLRYCSTNFVRKYQTKRVDTNVDYTEKKVNETGSEEKS